MKRIIIKRDNEIKSIIFINYIITFYYINDNVTKFYTKDLKWEETVPIEKVEDALNELETRNSVIIEC